MIKPKTMKQDGEITEIGVAEHTENSMHNYGIKVLEERAVADIRDGLKPVQRRILYSAHSLGLTPSKPFVKSSRIVGDTMGRFHPHGDSAIYGTLVNLVRAASPLMEGHGSFGTDLDPGVAAMRYTETKPTKLGASMFDDIAVADFIPNYDEKETEPAVLPTRVPMLVVNGSEGIAVGLSACIPPHNITEVLEACKLLLKNPDDEEFFKAVKGPDYGSGVLVSSRSEVEHLYQTGLGSLRYRCKYHYETTDEMNLLVITELPPRFRFGSRAEKGSFLAKCDELEQEGVIAFASDESKLKSDGSGMRIVVGFKSPKLLQDRFLKNLYLSIGYQFNSVFPDKSVGLSGLRGLLLQFLDFRRDIERKVLEKYLADTTAALAKEEAKLAALINIKALFEVLQKKGIADNALVDAVAKALDVTKEQAAYILSCEVRVLARANRAKLEDKIKAHKAEIDRLKAKLKDVDSVVLDRLNEMIKRFGMKRRMEITRKVPDMVESVGSVFVGLTKGGDFNKFATFPRANKQLFDFITVTDDTLHTICTSANVRVVEVLTQKRTGLKLGKDPIVGVVPSTKQRLIVKDKTGKVLITDLRDIRLRVGEVDYTVMNTGSELDFASGFDNDDQIVCWNSQYVAVHDAKDLKSKRKGSYGWRLLKGRSNYEVLVIPNGSAIMTDEGKPIRDFDELVSFKSKSLFVVGKNNIVTVQDRKYQMTALELASRLSKGEEISKVFPL